MSSVAQFDLEISRQEDRVRKEMEGLTKLRQERPEESVENFRFIDALGGKPASLSELFESHSDLILIHNMGVRCPMCTLWADGFNGYLAHLEDRAGFVVWSPDTAAQQKTLAAKRGWNFRMVSSEHPDFAEAMGFAGEDAGYGRYMPGISVFQKGDGRILRTNKASICPGDEYNAAWNLMDLLPNGRGEWMPKMAYPSFAPRSYK